MTEAEIRRVIINGLPSNIDNAIIASLIHGGALESYRLVKNPNTPLVTAVVTFASGPAAKAYYDKYANGLEVKIQGKRTIAIVEYGDTVDVVSGLLRGYLESGATRIVCAEGADEDWSMRALRKIGEEKNRKLEAIIDTSKDEVGAPSILTGMIANHSGSYCRISIYQHPGRCSFPCYFDP
jgi:hypothetical protein